MPIKRADPVSIPEPQPIHQRIAWWIENAFTRIFKRIFNALKDPVQDMLAYALEEFTDDVELGLLELLRPLLNEIQSYEELPTWMRQTIANAGSGSSIAGAFLLTLLAIPLVNVIQAGMQDAIAPIVAHRLNALVRAKLVDPFTAIELYRKKLINDDELLRLTRAEGWPDWQTDYIKQLSVALYDQGELINAHWRGLINDGQVSEQLSKRGYTSEHIALWKELAQRIPGPGELISIAVREGFDDQVARQFGYDEAFPAQAAEAAEKGGLAVEWFQRMWRAHWRLPSVTQGFDMFHRGIITKPQLELLLRASDIPSFWRTKLIELSYNVVTRVDVRRMYKLGVFSIDEVYDRYLARGYSPDDAQAMTEWTVREYAEEDRQLTKNDILRMYRDSILNDNEATAYLDALGFDVLESGLLLAREDLAKTELYEKEVIKNIKTGYIQYVFDDGDVYAQLGKLDPPAGFIEDQLALWKLERARRVIRPTVAQLKDMWLGEVITEVQLDLEMIGRGYRDLYIDWYKALWLKGG